MSFTTSLKKGCGFSMFDFLQFHIQARLFVKLRYKHVVSLLLSDYDTIEIEQLFLRGVRHRELLSEKRSGHFSCRYE